VCYSVALEVNDETRTQSSNYALLFMGDQDSFVLNQILLQQKALGITVVYTPESKGSLLPLKKLDNALGNDTFMKRYMLIEKAKKCEVFGIIVVNAWVHRGGKQAVRQMLELLKKHEKKGYVFTMSKLRLLEIN
jgi:diphthamide biosynthesis enzyme Dph1/Dph2-like protein